MIMGLYSVKDEFTCFTPPILSTNDEDATRYFEYKLNNTEIMKDNVKDFSLWKCGVFDNETGTITPCEPKLVIRGGNYERK